MKFLFSFLLLFLFIDTVHAQNDTTVIYYNRHGEPVPPDQAVKYSLQLKEGDHYKKLMVDGKDDKITSVEYFLDAECKQHDGPYRSFYKNGKPNTTGAYYQDKKNSVWRTWTDSGILVDSAVYRNGYIYGIGLQWNSDGKITDSLIFEEGGKGVSHGYWSDGQPKERGGYIAGKKEGLWTYYHKNGQKCQEVNYAADSALSYTCYDEQGKLQQKDCIYEQEANYPGGEKAWLAYLSDKLSNMKLPDDYYKGKIYGQVWIQFVVESDGSLSGLKVVESVDPRLDEAAMTVIKRSRRWNHAVQFNRPVKAYRLQPITFPKAE